MPHRIECKTKRRLLLAALGLAALLLGDVAPAQGRGPRPDRRRGPERPELPRTLPALQPHIDRAIDRGVEYLLSRQLRDGSWEEYSDTYGSGQAALSLYTLLKSGVPADHPAVQAGFTRLDHTQPRKTYTVSCHLLAYAALGDPARRARVEELLALLVDWQDGTYGYPGHPGSEAPDRGRAPLSEWTDLSNTQFAALGLRAAEHAGAKVPAKTWSDLLEATLEYQEEPHPSRAASAGANRTSTESLAAGFRYRVPRAEEGRGPGRGAESATGSMTAAGIAVLEICREGLGRRLTTKTSLQIDTAQRRALAWFDESFSVEQNPGGGGWLCYYLYGLERVGALLELDRIGGEDWYLEGARVLVSDQLPDGAWRSQTLEPSTCFALLFLERATARTTGELPTRTVVHTGEGAVRLRGTGTNPLTVWITGFDEAALAELAPAGGGPGGRGPRVARVEHLVDGRVVESLPGDPHRPWSGEQYATRHTFTTVGRHHVGTRVHVVPPERPASETVPTVVLESACFEVDIERLPADWMVPFVELDVENLLAGAEVEARASSGSNPAAAVDGLQSTRWLADASDRFPSLTLRFARALRADTIALSGPDARAAERGEHDAVAWARVTIDGDDPVSVRFPTDPLQPALLELDRPRTIHTLEIRLLERVPGSGRTHTVGVAEVGVFRGR